MKVHCLYDKLVPIQDLKFHPDNANEHPKDQIDRLAEILEFQGWRYPVKVSKLSGFITAGHGRVLAAVANKWKQVPVNFQDYDNEDQERADVHADNAIADWAVLDLSKINLQIPNFGPDFNIDMLGLKDFALDPADKFHGDEDEIPEVVEPKTKLGDIYQLGRHRLMCGDSTNADDVAALFAGETAELCFTSPPYADQREYNGGKELSTEFLAKFIRAAHGSVKYFAVNLGYSRKDGEVNPYWDDYIKEAKECGLKFLSWNVWDKGQAGSIGNQSAMFAISHEWIFVFGKEYKDLNKTKPNIRSGETMDRAFRRSDGSMYYSGDKFEVGDVSRINTVLNMFPQKDRTQNIDHPAMFPVGLPGAYIEAMTNISESVYDPFGGSGSTLIACEKTNRKCFMMELDPYYCDVIVARWEKYTGKKAELMVGGSDDAAS